MPQEQTHWGGWTKASPNLGLPPSTALPPHRRLLNNLHLHLALGIPEFVAPEFFVEDVSGPRPPPGQLLARLSA